MDTNDGGYNEMGLGYLISWLGSIYEEMDLYSDRNQLSATYNSVIHVQNYYYLPARTSYTDNDTIKLAVLKYGAVKVSYNSNNTLYGKNKTNITTNINYNPTTIEIILSKNINTEAILTINNTNQTINIINEKATVKLDLKTENYTGTITINDLIYDGNTTINLNIPKIKTMLTADDVDIYYQNGKYSVKLTDYAGKPLEKANITIEINEIPYTRITNENGTAAISINIGVGTHNLKTIYEGDDKYDAAEIINTAVIKSTIQSENIIKYHKNDTQFLITLTDKQGNILPFNNVTFNINGVFYVRKTNELGVAKLNINLNPDTYIITTINSVTNELKSNNITVLPTITENSNLVKYYKNDSQYTVKLLDKQGNIMNNTKVYFNINGVLYERTSNNEGIAKLNINLVPGTYVITVIYDECLISNTVTVKSPIVSEDLEMNYKDGSKFKVTLLDNQGNKVEKGEHFVLNINGVLYQRNTDENGSAGLSINLNPGIYIITCQYGESLKSNTITIRETI